MLSIEKMEIDSSDSDMDLLEERPTKSKEIDITEEPGRALYYHNAQNVFEKLEMIPIVYTTRLEDMPALQWTSYPIQADPRDVSARILKQSKPMLRTLPIKKRRRYKKRFEAMKGYLQEIYTNIEKNIEDNPAAVAEAEPSIEINDERPDILIKQIELDSVKSKVLNEPSCEKPIPKNTCKYSDLLKLCKPCSVVLPGICRHASNAVIHGGQVLKVNKVQKPGLATLLREPSSDEEQPLITLCPELLTRNITEVIGVNQKDGKNCAENEKVSSRSPNVIPVNNSCSVMKKVTDAAQIAPRLIRNGLLELVDRFSNEYSMYFMDNYSNLLVYIKDTTDKAHLYENKHYSSSSYTSILNNCCWVKKDELLQSLYPKVLVYPNSRFMRTPHPCKPGACVCCCRKRENIEKPNIVMTAPSTSSNRKSLDKEDMELQDLEDKIKKSIIDIKKTPKLNSSEWLRRLLTPIKSRSETQNNLIGRALTYKKPQPKDAINSYFKETKDNRRLETLKKGDPQNSVLILRNFALDVTEIYEINSDLNIETSIVTTCYNNTSRPDVKKLLKNPKAVNETVCCWFKREAVITKLHNNKLLSSVAKTFIRTNHTCTINECACCCKPKPRREYKLVDIQLPSRTDWSTTLNPLKSSQDFQPQLVSSFSLATETQSAELQIRPPLLVPLSQTSTSGDDDCLITSVMTSPSLWSIPQGPTVPILPTVPTVLTPVPMLPTAPPKTIVATVTAPTNIMVTDVVDSDEMSQEVNSLITSILDRFKDVRLTINSDGKVAAALNTPVNTLSTVELKVLANILSFAQSQVNLLGANSHVNSGMSLSNIINLKVDDVQNSTLDPSVVYKAFGKSQGPSQPNNANNIPLTLPHIAPKPTQTQTYAFFSNSTSIRNQHFNEAFSSFIHTKMNPEPPTETATPVIENVFSLKEEPDETETSTTTVWYRKPAAEPGVSTLSEKTLKTYTNNSQKRKDIESSTSNPKKIKVISPSKLGATATDVSEYTSIVHNHTQQTASVGGFSPVLPLLSNNNFQLISSSHTQPSFNSTLPTTTSQPMLVINPLNTPNFVNTGSTMSVPFTNNSLKVQNVMSMSQPQPNIPFMVNAMSRSNLVETESTNVPVEQAMTSVATVPELTQATDGEGRVNNELDENSSTTLSADLETKLEYNDDEPDEENYEHDGPSQPQPNIPFMVNAMIRSNLVETETNVPVEQAMTSVATGPGLTEAADEEGRINNELDENSSTLSADLETKLEYSDDEPEEENYEHDRPEVENCDEADVCILGF